MKKYFDESMNCYTVEQASDILNEIGWAVLAPDFVANKPEPLLKNFGQMMPQYDGNLRWEVRPRPGFEKIPYSQSSNGIGAHTEAPVLSPPPKYLALHCRQQAQCGGGQTMLADGVEFCEQNGGVTRFQKLEVSFIAAPMPGCESKQSKFPLLSINGKDPVFRFSYNLFKYGDVNPSEDAVVESASAFNQDQNLVDLAVAAENFFNNNGTAILIPDSAVLIWDNHRLMHSRTQFSDAKRHLTRYWLSPQ